MQSRCPLARMTGMLLTLMLPSAVSAFQLDYLVELGLERNDNVNLSEDDPESATILRPMLGFNLQQEGSTVQANASGVVEYRDYTGGEFSNEFRGQLAGHLNWTMMPERLNLTIEDYVSVQPIDPLAQDTPNNQQQTNVFAIGPTLNFRLGPTVRGQAELRYINSHAEETQEFNTQRVSGALRAIKDLSTTSTISANVVDERIDFTEADAGPDYSRYSVFGRYTRNWTRLDLLTDFGYSWLDYSGNTIENRHDPLARATLNWRASERSTFTVDAAYQFSDAASGMMTTAIGTTIPTNIATGDATTTSQAYLEQRLALGYAYRGDRTGFTVAPYYRKLDYSSSDTEGETGLDQTGKGATAGMSYLLRPLISTGLTATGENLNYDQIAREDKSWTVTAFLRQQWARNWSWRVELTHYKRDSSAPGQSSDQNIAYFGITYTR